MVEHVQASDLRILGFGGTLRRGSRSLAALDKALEGAKSRGASTMRLDLRQLDLPFFRPGVPLSDYPMSVAEWVEAARQADGMIWSTGAYHGTLTGATKNALDFLEFLAVDGYLDGLPVGLIAVSGGRMAAVRAIDAMVHSVHALRGTVIPLTVAIGKSREAISPEGQVEDRALESRLHKLGQLLAETAAPLSSRRVLAV